ncbi:hypothetical protein HPP92_014041 [Vanilla planifolia]|uniref:CCAAT-binding factor domain-containing protein n=1 Tax=Vanilla planifolia TaxID=51239 RepID=A0A835QPI9_VANPL|nr:hypothetical protein HPP92_014041 [Vanilla planifolia]
MALAETKPSTTKPKKHTAEDVELITSEVASFASSLGFGPPLPLASGGGAGFDDSDFRKKGRIKPLKLRAEPVAPSENVEKRKDSEKKFKAQPKAKPHPLQIDNFKEPYQKIKNLPKLPLMNPSLLSGHWYVDEAELEGRVLGKESTKLTVMGLEELKDLVMKKKELAETLLAQYTREYEVTRKKSGDMRLLLTTAKMGTSVDKVSAFTCLVEDNPMANMRALDALLSMVTSKVGKRYAFTGFEALRELFLLRLLPDRKLKNLIQRPLDRLPENKDGYSLLVFWFWEECLKQRYERFVIALEEALKDVLPSLKDKAMKTSYVLLMSKPEQERRLLSALVNKLGDPERKTASTAGYHLTCLLSEHPNMKAVVIDEVDSFLFRPHIGPRAKYHAINFLSQILLSKRGDGHKIAKRLVDVYFALFKLLISEVGKEQKPDNKKSDKGTGKIGHKGRKFKEKKNSLLKSKENLEGTHMEMDSRLLSALLTGVNRAFPYVSSEEADDILENHTPVLFKLVHSESFNVGVQALMLLYQITTKNHIASDRFYRALYAKLLMPAALNSSKPEMFLGLLVKAMKNDINMRRVSAFSKRLLQVALQRPPHFTCGCLFLLSEVLKAKPPLWTLALQKESVDDELEHFEDIIEEDQGMLPEDNSKNINSEKASCLNDDSTITGQIDDCKGEDQSQLKSSSHPGGYNPRHREPVFCNADRTGWWELTILASHVHPSVSTMARTLLSGVNIVYNGNPLIDLSLGAFLDKFVEKKGRSNKKAAGTWHGGSQIAPARKLDMSHHLIGDEILQLAEKDVPPEDVVFHRFYMNKTSSSKKSKAKKKKKKGLADDDDDELLLDQDADDGDDASIGEEDEEEIDDMLGAGPLEEEEGGYDYDDLDRVIKEDDEDLLGNDIDTETQSADDNEFVGNDDLEDDDDVDRYEDDGDGDFENWNGDLDDSDGDDDNGEDYNSSVERRKKKRKADKKSKRSPFSSLEDFEHLLKEKRDSKDKPKSKKKRIRLN